MTDLNVHVVRSVDLPAPPEEVFELLANVPDSIAHFPNLEKVVELGDNRFHWFIKKAGVGKMSVQMIYACEYHSDRETLDVHWTPIAGKGNGMVTGGWTIEPQGSGTRLTARNDMVLSVKLPRMMKRVAEPIARSEKTRFIEEYLENLRKTFSGGDGRVSTRVIQLK